MKKFAIILAIRNLKGFGITFKEDDRGKINALIFNQPNGNFRAEKKNWWCSSFHTCELLNCLPADQAGRVV